MNSRILLKDKLDTLIPYFYSDDFKTQFTDIDFNSISETDLNNTILDILTTKYRNEIVVKNSFNDCITLFGRSYRCDDGYFEIMSGNILQDRIAIETKIIKTKTKKDGTKEYNEHSILHALIQGVAYNLKTFAATICLIFDFGRASSIPNDRINFFEKELLYKFEKCFNVFKEGITTAKKNQHKRD